MDTRLAEAFLAILNEELVPAMGCTEPIALAFAAARGREILGREPEWMAARCSGNIIKNVRCVRIPHSGGMTGIEAACALGALGGDAARRMEVLESVTDEHRRAAEEFLRQKRCAVEYLDTPIPLHFVVELWGGGDTVTVEVRHSHTGIVRIQKNQTVVFETADLQEAVTPADRSGLSVEAIKEFADTVELSRIAPFARRQIDCNMAIAQRGMEGGYGLGIGRALLQTYGDSVLAKAKAFAAAASEARMEGCDLPVIITSGSGNQGIASTVPVIVWANETGASAERLYRALSFSSLMTVYQKEYIGKLSAFCGAVSAACAAGAAVTYLVGGTVQQIKATVDNTLADIPGILCDGAKASCAAKIASAVDAALFSHTLAMRGKVYAANTGLLQDDAGKTISSVGHIGRIGMKETDAEIVKLMIE